MYLSAEKTWALCKQCVTPLGPGNMKPFKKLVSINSQEILLDVVYGVVGLWRNHQHFVAPQGGVGQQEGQAWVRALLGAQRQGTEHTAEVIARRIHLRRQQSIVSTTGCAQSNKGYTGA